MGNYKKLFVWQKAKDAAIKIYAISKEVPFRNDFGFCNQIQKAAISVPSNIAEGNEMKSLKQKVHYFLMAKGSSIEVITQLMIAYEINYISKIEYESLIDDYEHISIMLHKWIENNYAPKK